MPHDARAVANSLLDEADKLGLGITPLALQKILYFVQGWWLANHGEPLIRQAFEAWQYGPVLRLTYNSFKNTPRAEPISSRAHFFDFISGKSGSFSAPLNEQEREHIRSCLRYYAPLGAFTLVELTHEKNGPWDLAAREATHAPGQIIPNELIRAHFSASRPRTH